MADQYGHENKNGNGNEPGYGYEHGYGYNAERDGWSMGATEGLFPAIARQVFLAQKIEYAWRSSIKRLDLEYGVDALIKTPRKHVAVAIRIRGKKFHQYYQDLTLRYESLQTPRKLLETQKSIARFMFYGWGDTDRPLLPARLVDWYVVWLQELTDAVIERKIPYKGPFSNKDRSSKFIAFDLNVLQQKGLILTCAQDVEMLKSKAGISQPWSPGERGKSNYGLQGIND
jgi:hypothetical protein